MKSAANRRQLFLEKKFFWWKKKSARADSAKRQRALMAVLLNDEMMHLDEEEVDLNGVIDDVHEEISIEADERLPVISVNNNKALSPVWEV